MNSDATNGNFKIMRNYYRYELLKTALFFGNIVEEREPFALLSFIYCTVHGIFVINDIIVISTDKNNKN